MPTNFPGALDSLPNNRVKGNPIPASDHNDQSDVLMAVQAKVGVDSSAVPTSLDYRVSQLEDGGGSLVVSVNGETGAVVLDKTDLGLGSVDNTSDASKPVSSAAQTALNAKAAGAASSTDNAVARFDSTTGKVLQNSSLIADDDANLTLSTPSGVLDTKGGLNLTHTNGTGTSAYRVSQDDSDILRVKRTGDTTGDGAVYALMAIVSPTETTSGDSEATLSLATRQNGTGSKTRVLDVYNDEYSRDLGMGFRQLLKNNVPAPYRFEFHDKTVANGAFTLSGCTFTNGSPVFTYTSATGFTPSAEDWVWDNALTYIPDDTKIVSVVGTTVTMNRNATASGSGVSARGKNIREIARMNADRQLLVRKFIAANPLNVAEFGGPIQAGGYVSSDGTSGASATTGGATFKDGLYVSGTISGGGSGDVVGPASATDNALARFDTGTGKLVQNSAVTVDDSGNLFLPNSGLRMKDTNASHDLIFAMGSNITADRTISFFPGDASRNVTITANASIGGTMSGLNTGDQTIALTGDVTGSGTGSFAATLATVNANVGSFTNASVTVNAKGLVTAVSSGTSSGIVRSVSSISSGTTAGSAASTDYVYLCTGTFSLGLPAASGNSNRYTVKNAGTGTVTVDPNGTETVDGSLTAAVLAGQSVDLISDGTNWNVI